ncbi:hypothetical protein [Pseudomonas sp. A34-9]|uniref:hypothetical protein n=1 Tax=Pseudomonas sp. A34-9 TaxID=3034675 RepID=UPI00240D7B40|nr:hypothetical protein [Pseudomonas sp. A34-9]
MLKKTFIIVALFITVSGCAQIIKKLPPPFDYATGEYVSIDQMSTFTDKITTKDDVIGVIGQPSKKSEVAGTEIWSYEFKFFPGFQSTKKEYIETTFFEFDNRGVLTKHYKNVVNTQNGRAITEK